MPDLGTFSFSRVSTFEQCARRYRYRYVDGVREAFQSIEGFMGQQAHVALEWLYRERDAGRPPEVADLIRYYCDSFDRGYRELGGELKVIKQDTNVEDYRSSGAAMLKDYHLSHFVKDDLTTEGLEQHFVLEIDDGRRFQGFIDRLARDESGVLHIIDYKTGARVPSDFGGKDGDQLKAYAVAMFEKTDAAELVLRLDYLRRGKSLSHRIRREESVEVARRLGERIRFAAEANVFPTNAGILCGWCGFNDICEDGQAFTRRRAR